MNLKECYTAINGDYEGVVGRLRSERLVRKFALKFLDDPSYDTLLRSVEEGNRDEAFRASHTIKGVCQNLGFSKLGDSSSRLTEALRSGSIEGAEALLQEVKEDYIKTAEALKLLDA